jgi:hypothetical protein
LASKIVVPSNNESIGNVKIDNLAYLGKIMFYWEIFLQCLYGISFFAVLSDFSCHLVGSKTIFSA